MDTLHLFFSIKREGNPSEAYELFAPSSQTDMLIGILETLAQFVVETGIQIEIHSEQEEDLDKLFNLCKDRTQQREAIQ